MYNFYATIGLLSRRAKRAAAVLALAFGTITPGIVSGQVYSVTTSPPHTASTSTSTGSGITFNVKARQGAIKIVNFTAGLGTGSGTWAVWYKTDSVNGAPNVSTANGWVQHETGSYSGATGNIANLNMVKPIKIPAGKTYGFCIQNVTASVVYSSAASPYTFRDAKLQIQTGTSVGYSGTLPSPTITPRVYCGTVYYKMDNNANNNAGVVSIPMYNCPGTFDVKAVIENAGKNQIKSVKINWSKNGVTQTPVTYSGTLDTSGGAGATSATVTLGTHTWAKGNSLTLKIWTSDPNSAKDTVNDNDTITVVIKPSMTGTYTIGGTSPDYSTIAAALTDLSTNGVCGPVNLDIRAGTYTGQVIIKSIPGASAANAITFKGAGKGTTTLTNAGTSTTNMQTVLLDGADYITFKDMTISATGATYGLAVMLSNGADYNTIQDCEILSSLTSTATTTGGIIGSGTLTSATSTGMTGNYNTFLRNTVQGGYYGITMMGAGTGVGGYVMGNKYIDNVISDFYGRGMYLYYSGESKIIGNKLNSTRSTTTYGLYFYGHSNYEMSRNEVNVPYYGIYAYYGNYYNYDNLGTPLTINNNIFNSSSLYGTYFYYLYYADFHHNTVRGNSTYAALFNYTVDADVIGNIFWNTSTGYAFYASAGSFKNIDYNIYYAPSATSAIYFGTAYSNLAAWQSAYSDINKNSWQQDPLLTSGTDLHITQTTAVPFGPENIYTVDVDGDSRCRFAPTVGADESNLGKSMQPKAGMIAPDTLYVNSPAEIFGNRTNGVPHGNRWYVDNVLMEDSLDFVVTISKTGTHTIKVVAYSCQKKDSATKTVLVIDPPSAPSPDFLASLNAVRTGGSVSFTDLSTGGATTWAWDITPKTAYNQFGILTNTYAYTYGDSSSRLPTVRFDLPGLYKVCLTAKNSKGSNTLCRSKYVRVLPSYNLGQSVYNVTDSAGYLFDKNGPNAYYANNEKGYIRIAPCAEEVYLIFNRFELECGWDYVRVYDGADNKGTPLHCTSNPGTGTAGPGLTGVSTGSCAQNCRPSPTDTFKALSGMMYIEMSTDASDQDAGFEAYWWIKPKKVDPPKASFDMPATACVNLPVQFTNASTGDGLSYRWDLDNDFSQFETYDKDAKFTYTSAGKYNVTLIVTNCGGIDTFQKEINIVTPAAPGVSFTVDNTKPTITDVVFFKADIKECVNEYQWRFTPSSGTGKAVFVNGTSQTSANPQVTFSDTGCYNVFLLAKNSGGADSVEVSCYIHAKNPYCTPVVSTNINDIGISQVQLLTLNDEALINNKSSQGVDDYQSFVGTVSATIERGVSYDLKVARNTNLNSVTRTMWIDWNLDGDFADNGEKVAESRNASTLTWTTRFTVPVSAKTGASVMRIAINQGNLNNSVCGPNKYGEYEDYRVYITPDLTRPVITLIDADTIYLEQGYAYTDSGAKAEDNLDGDITGNIVKTEKPPFDNMVVGEYLIQFDVKDASGNPAERVTRVVIVTPDKTAPDLEVSGKDTTRIEVGDPNYIEPEATKAMDLVDIDLLSEVVKTGAVDVNKVGTYVLTYTVTDLSGNTATVIRVVIVEDRIAPVLELTGKDTVYHEVNTPYIDAGVTYTDNYCTNAEMAGNLWMTHNVDETRPGTYTVVYNLTDCNGNEAVPVTRTVIVQDTKAPSVSLNGDSLIVLDVFDTYKDAGITAADNYGTPEVTVSGSYFSTFTNGKATVLGDYTVIYTVKDSFGNSAVISRTIHVVDRVAPVIELEGVPSVNTCRWVAYKDAGYDLTDNYYDTSDIKVTREGDFTVTGTMLPGVYSFRYIATDKSGNVGYSDWRIINVREAGTGACATGLDESASLGNRISIYPNPTTGKFTLGISLNSSEQVNIKVVNSLGQMVAEVTEGNISSGSYNIDLSNESSGVYTLHIIAGDQSAVKRIVVAK
jgi:parallel beta-helix repeat protein